MVRIVDYAAGRPGAQAIQDAGFQGAIRYLANSPDRGLPNKILVPEEARDFLDRGMLVTSCFQQNKADADGGYQLGAVHARAALDWHFHCGGPGFRPIYFTPMDRDTTLREWNERCRPYLDGVASVLGKEWVGVYGGQRTMWWAAEEGYRWRWQTRGWSRYDISGGWHNEWPTQWVPGVQIRQERVDEDTIAGIGIDVNTTWAEDFGQWQGPTPAPLPPPPASGAAVKPNFTEIDKSNEGNSSNRHGAAVRLFVLHTEEGNQTAEGLHEWMRRNGVSYHYTVRDGLCIDSVNTDRASWSVLDANPYTINLVFAGSKAAQGREVWLSRYGRDIEIAAWLFVQDAGKYDPLDPTVIDWDGVGAGRAGGTDHMGITKGLGIGTHTDCGPNFPWDVYIDHINRFATGAMIVAVVPNAIEEQYKVTPWLGAKLTSEPELACPDGRGRYAQYEHGYIYWTPKTGAIPVPTNLFETWAQHGYEAGDLGYPVTFHAVLPDVATAVGDVQAFERGVLYRRYGQPGYVVHGAIGDRWMRSGFENGPFGWPISDELPTGDGIGRMQLFDKGRILWYPDGTVGMQPTEGDDYVVPDNTM